MQSVFSKSIQRYITRTKGDEALPREDLVEENLIPLVQKAEQDRVPSVVADNMLHNRLLLIGIATFTAINTIGLLGLAFKQSPDLVFAEDGSAYRIRSIPKNEQDESKRIQEWMANNISVLLTFSNLRPDESDPTKRNFVVDEKRDVVMKDNSTVSIPYTNWKKQFMFTPGYRLSGMRWIASLYKEVQNEIQNKTASGPYNAFDTYRFEFFQLDGQSPVRVRREISPGVWEVVFTGRIFKYTKAIAPGSGLSQKSIFRNISLIARVKRVLQTEQTPDRDDDLLGYQVDVIAPYNPQADALPAPKQ
jgi:hypothetical protein